jgi:hypothetical protein
MSQLSESKTIQAEVELVNSSTTAASSESSTLSALRVMFVKSSSDGYATGTFGVALAEGVKVFVCVFSTDEGSLSAGIQIPLVGQSVSDLVSSLNEYDNIRAEVLNNLGYLSTSYISYGTYVDGTNAWVYVNSASSPVNSQSGDLRTSIKFYLTTVEPTLPQFNQSQSLGGHVSPTETNDYARLSAPASIYDTTLYIDPDSLSNGFDANDLMVEKYLQINDEVVEVNRWDKNTAFLASRNVFGTPLRYHEAGSVIKALNRNGLFDRAFSKEGKQYRCIAVRNTHPTLIAKDAKIYLGLESRNPSDVVRIAIEVPRSEKVSGTVTTSGITAFSASGLAGLYETNLFKDAIVVFTSGENEGQWRKVTSFEKSTGSFVLESRLGFSIDAGDTFYVETAPSQRIKSGIVPPSLVSKSSGTPYLISEFAEADTIESAIPINVGGLRSSGDLKPNETVYVWIERSIDKYSEEFPNNRVALSLSYSRT